MYGQSCYIRCTKCGTINNVPISPPINKKDKIPNKEADRKV
jgi:uncharacterized Zn finger protein